MVGRFGVRFHVRVLSLGFWVLLLGGVLLYATSRALTVVASASPTAGASHQAATSMTPVASAEPLLLGALHDGLRGVLHVGAASVAVGAAVLVAGGWLLRSTVRSTSP